MKTFDVYHPWKIELIQGRGSFVTDSTGKKYLDCYGGHGVISIGHNHPVWKLALNDRLNSISYYSNAVTISEQEEVARLLEQVSGLTNYQLFLCNSGAEANENALKVASFHTGRSKVLSFTHAFHGRTIGAIAVTDNPNITAPFGKELDQVKIALNDKEALVCELSTKDYAAVIIEGIQGVAGVFEAETTFWKQLREICTETGTLLVADEIQSGCGRTGTYCAFQYHDIRPDIITMAKGIGNGFPVAAVLIDAAIEPKKGQLGTTFGGSYLACAAMKVVLEVIEKEQLMSHAAALGAFLKTAFQQIEGVKAVRGRGLMLGIELEIKAATVQQQLLEKGFVTGTSSCPNTLRILPPLNVKQAEMEQFISVFSAVMETLLQAQLSAS